MYTINSVIQNLRNTLHEYLEADYHVWDESLIEQRQRLLSKEKVTINDPYLEANPRYKSGTRFSELKIPKSASELLTALAGIDRSGIYSVPRSHQCEALEKFLGDEKEIIVSTGTGSGKTESFLYPILGSLAIEASRNKDVAGKPGMRALLLYPMNALVNDQLTRLRKMLGNKQVAEQLAIRKGRNVGFGVYTSRTDYPGKREATRDKRLADVLGGLYLGSALRERGLLEEEGLWPAKNIEKFLSSNLTTSVEDSEYLTRQEIQAFCPDILVTNYSMLEYMLARPIERSIFEQTSDWLASDPENSLIIVLDETHVYRGVAGAEVALLLRRLFSRLNIDRNRVRFILTSASLGSEEDRPEALKFARELTGKTSGDFVVISSQVERVPNEAPFSERELNALSAFDLDAFLNIHNDPKRAIVCLNTLLNSLGLPALSADVITVNECKDALYDRLTLYPPAAFISNRLTARPYSLAELHSTAGIRNTSESSALEALLALMTFAQESKTGQVFLPVRLHLMFRGIPGIYACVNRDCSVESASETRLFGAIYTAPRLQCKCGGRVFEVYTHRDCGAAFISGYVNRSDSSFLLSEESRDPANTNLLQVHFLMETGRTFGPSRCKYLHIYTGKLLDRKPDDKAFREVVVSDNKAVVVAGKEMWTFDSKCPVCAREWVAGETKIQDLATKGEAPFSYLVNRQVTIQPPTRKRDARYPLAGRKSLIFSDGRQKAARLARSMPTVIEKDVFRALLFLALQRLAILLPRAPIKKEHIYLSFLLILRERNVSMFIGDDSHTFLLKDLKKLDEHIKTMEELNGEFDAKDPITFMTLTQRDTWSQQPPRFDVYLLANLSDPYRSLNSLLLAAIVPAREELLLLSKRLSSLELKSEDLLSITHAWLTMVIEENYAYDQNITDACRRLAAGGLRTFGVGADDKLKFFKKLPLDSAQQTLLRTTFIAVLCEEKSNRYYVKPTAIRIDLAHDKKWWRCGACTRLAFLPLFGHCPHKGCKSTELKEIDPATSSYLRARKSFYRSPVISAIAESHGLFNLNVKEHTAQLSHRDDKDINSTNERYERRFKDILASETDTPIDVLSCTTTMEVGVDIGSLIAVAMRNVPPARQNYQQRAGRAGRRGAAISTVITFAQTGSHDSHYFENPEEIIAGKPMVPRIDISNEKVLRRHANAAMLQSFFHRSSINLSEESNDLLSVLGLTKEFYEGDGSFTFTELKTYLRHEFPSTRVASEIATWLPNSFLTVAKLANELLEELASKCPNDFAKTDEYEEKFLDFLFYCDLLPTYAFPRNIANLRIETRDTDFSPIRSLESPQQGLATALTEYAPGRVVIVDQKKYIIGSITAKSSSKERDRARRLFEKKHRYFQCSNCFFTENDTGDHKDGQTCTHCGSTQTTVMDVLQPETVYPRGRQHVNEYNDEDDTYTQATTAQLPFVGEEDNKTLKAFKKNALVSSRVNQELVMINPGDTSNRNGGGFWVCVKCGRSTPDEAAPSAGHERDYFVQGLRTSEKCDGSFSRVNLGYTFNSDVFLMRIPVTYPLRQDFTGAAASSLMLGARTLGEAILKEASIYLQIDPSELSSGVRLLKVGAEIYLDLFVYDTAAGGAGYAKLIGDYLSAIFDNARRHLTKDCCQSSCYRCLRNYGNRFVHTMLNRAYGLQLMEYIAKGEIPGFFDYKKQKLISIPFIQLLELDDVKLLSEDSGESLKVLKNGRKLAIAVYPSLVDPSVAREKYGNDVFIVNELEIGNDLSGAYSRFNDFYD